MVKRCAHCRGSVDDLPALFSVVHWPPAFLVVKESESAEGLFVVVDVFDTEREAQASIRAVLRKHEAARS